MAYQNLALPDSFRDKIASIKCKSPHHDDRYCSTCEAMRDGAEQMYTLISEELLKGVMVEIECMHYTDSGYYVQSVCPICNSTGTITRQATIEDIWDIRELIMHLDHIANHSECSMSKDWAKSALYTKSGGRLVIKNDEKD